MNWAKSPQNVQLEGFPGNETLSPHKRGSLLQGRDGDLFTIGWIISPEVKVWSTASNVRFVVTRKGLLYLLTAG